METKEVNRTANINEIDAKVKNKIRWEWLSDKNKNGDFLSNYVRKISKSGHVICKWCDKLINHGAAGKRALNDHSKSVKHRARKIVIQRNQTLPAVFTTT